VNVLFKLLLKGIRDKLKQIVENGLIISLSKEKHLCNFEFFLKIKLLLINLFRKIFQSIDLKVNELKKKR